MKTITINVTCQYDVEFSREVPDDVYDQLMDICDNGCSIDDGSHNKAMDWLANNVNEDNALNLVYEINDLNDGEL